MLLLWRDRLLFLTLALLPWQARYILKTATLFGVPWEQGTSSVFAVEALLACAAIFHFIAVVAGKAREDRRVPFWFKLAGFLPLAALASAAWAPEPVAALLASARLAEGYALAYLIWVSRLSLAALLGALAFGTVLTSLLGLWQFFTQTSFASTLLGIAVHPPQTPGTAVVETASGRFLRAYGSLPHPNVLGGYAAAGLAACLALAARPSRFRWAAFSAASVLGAGLAASFSRSAWVAAAVVSACIILFPRVIPLRESFRRFAPALAAAAAGAAVVVLFALPLLTARLSLQGRLETRSIAERAASVSGGADVFLRTYATGTGAGNYLPAAFSFFGVPPNPYAVQPPHFVPLLVAAELGIFGLAVLLGFSGLWWLAAAWVMRRTSSPTHAAAAALPLIILVVSLFDHYPFDLFAGTVLSGACFGCFLKAGEIEIKKS